MIRRFFSQAWLYHKGRTAAFKLSEFVIHDVGYPLITLVFYCLLAAYGFRTMDLTEWVIGNAFLLCTNTCVFGMGTMFQGERYYGRLRSIVASPCNKLALVLANGVGPMMIAIVTVAFQLFIGGVIFKVDFSGVNIGLVIVTIFCAMLSASCFGLLIAVFGMITSSIHLVLNIINYVLMIFTGAEFPVSQLPLPGQVISRLLPLTRTIQAMKLLFGKGDGNLVGLLLGEIGLALLYAFFAWALFRLAEQICRRSGAFELF